jgi:biopolymer transport protein ExbD
MRLRRSNAHSEDSHGIDLAPMLDFILNLLIFFIITAVFVREYGMTVNRVSGAGGPSGGESSSITISLLGDGEVIVDNRVVDVRAVRANVQRLHAANPEHGVLIVADPDSAAGTLAFVVDQVRLGGIYNISFGTSD